MPMACSTVSKSLQYSSGLQGGTLPLCIWLAPSGEGTAHHDPRAGLTRRSCCGPRQNLSGRGGWAWILAGGPTHRTSLPSGRPATGGASASPPGPSRDKAKRTLEIHTSLFSWLQHPIPSSASTPMVCTERPTLPTAEIRSQPFVPTLGPQKWDPGQAHGLRWCSEPLDTLSSFWDG